VALKMTLPRAPATTEMLTAPTPAAQMVDEFDPHVVGKLGEGDDGYEASRH